MQQNVGKIDQVIRVIIAIVLIATGVYLENYIISAVGLVPLITGFIKICPLYAILGVNTVCKLKEEV